MNRHSLQWLLVAVAAVSLSVQGPAGIALAQDPNRNTAAPVDPALHRAVRSGNLPELRALLQNGADPNVRDGAGRTPLIVAAEQDRLDAARLLIAAGANLNVSTRGSGTALESAERAGHAEFAAMLRRAGARTSGKSVGDKVCVRPWQGDGYCGVVEAIDRTAYRIRITDLVGCENGCPAKGECSAGKPAGGPDGLHAGDTVTTVSWCLTHTGVGR
jgi:hypothetical protein